MVLSSSGVDGSYISYFVKYNITDAEILNLRNGIPVNVVGRTHISKVSNESSLSIQSESQSCHYEISIVDIPCDSSEKHTVDEVCNLTDPNRRPRRVITIDYKCESLDDGLGNGGGGGGSGINNPWDGAGGDGYEGGDGTGWTAPSECGNNNGILTGPQTPSNDISDGSCGYLVPTNPNPGGG